MIWYVIGERSEPPSDKLRGEICISLCALVYLSYGVVWPDNQYHAHSHCVRILVYHNYIIWFEHCESIGNRL